MATARSRAVSPANKNTKMTTMTRRSTLFILAAGALILAWGASQFLFLPLLKLSFTSWFKELATPAAGDTGIAMQHFQLALTCLFVMVPLSALVTERFATQAKYSHSLAKSVLVGLLAFGTVWLYQHEALASQVRIAAKLGAGYAGPARLLTNDPLTSAVWFTAVCLVVFGPLDLWIARLQNQSRRTAQAVVAPEKESAVPAV